MAASRRGARVELVGRTGDDAAGDSLLLTLSRAGVGHVAMLRDPARGTPVVMPVASEPSDGEAPFPLDGGDTGSPVPGAPASGPAPRLEPADVSLGLEYVTGYGVLVVTDDVPESVVPVAAEAAAFAGAHLVLLVPPGREAPAVLSAEATVLAAPDEADEGAFATLVGEYAAALDAGISPAAAFAAATGDAGWEPLEV